MSDEQLICLPDVLPTYLPTYIHTHCRPKGFFEGRYDDDGRSGEVFVGTWSTYILHQPDLAKSQTSASGNEISCKQREKRKK